MIGAREVVDYVHPHVPAPLRAGIHPGALGEDVTPRHIVPRQESRVSEQRVCTYELCESIDEKAVVIQEGEAFSLNRSQHGILLLMGYSPNVKQVLELHIPETQWRRSLNLGPVDEVGLY